VAPEACRAGQGLVNKERKGIVTEFEILSQRFHADVEGNLHLHGRTPRTGPAGMQRRGAAICRHALVMSRLRFIGPCIVIYSYSTTNKTHLFLKLFILVKRSSCFGRSFRPSSGAQNCTYSNRHMSNTCCYLLLAGTRWNS